MIGEPDQKPAGMPGGIAASGACRLLAVDEEDGLLREEIDALPIVQRGAKAEGAIRLIVGEQSKLGRAAGIGEAGLDQLDRGMEGIHRVPHLGFPVRD